MERGHMITEELKSIWSKEDFEEIEKVIKDNEYLLAMYHKHLYDGMGGSFWALLSTNTQYLKKLINEYSGKHASAEKKLSADNTPLEGLGE